MKGASGICAYFDFISSPDDKSASSIRHLFKINAMIACSAFLIRASCWQFWHQELWHEPCRDCADKMEELILRRWTEFLLPVKSSERRGGLKSLRRSRKKNDRKGRNFDLFRCSLWEQTSRPSPVNFSTSEPAIDKEKNGIDICSTQPSRNWLSQQRQECSSGLDLGNPKER